MVDDCPVIVAANRDEHYDRPSTPPDLWSTEPNILAGKDLLAGGTWLGVNENGLLVGVLNRRVNRTAAPLTPTRSRGLLCLDLLRLQSAADACVFVNRHQEAYQPFTVVFADSREAWVAYNTRRGIDTHRLDEGLHVYSSAAPFGERTEKVDRAHSQFIQVVTGPGWICDDKSEWVRSLSMVLADHSLGNGSNDPKDTICVHGDVSGTVSSTIIFLSRAGRRFDVFNCAGPPCLGSFAEPLTLNVR